jgi:acylphosphatase
MNLAHDADALLKQLDELNLIRCSLLPGEVLTFLDDTQAWTNLLDAHATWTGPSHQSMLVLPRLQIKLESANTWFEVEIPRQYAGDLQTCRPTFSVKGENISRPEQERWQIIIEEKLDEIADTEYIGRFLQPTGLTLFHRYPIYQLLSLHLLPLLQAELDARPTQLSSHTVMSNYTSTSCPYHALLTSHHLISPNKRRSLQQWSSSLSITGFAKVGYPGVIYAQGQQENVEEFVANVKAMQWLALKVRFVEPIDESIGGHEKQWSEFQKVGEVVEEMRRIGREKYIVEMGIGSAG